MQLMTTQATGVTAIIAQVEVTTDALMEFLLVVCEDEIVNLEGKTPWVGRVQPSLCVMKGYFKLKDRVHIVLHALGKFCTLGNTNISLKQIFFCEQGGAYLCPKPALSMILDSILD